MVPEVPSLMKDFTQYNMYDHFGPALESIPWGYNIHNFGTFFSAFPKFLQYQQN